MRRILLCVGVSLVAIAGVAHAQTPTEDPRVAIYRQLLTEANDRLAVALGQNQTVQAELAKLRAEKPDGCPNGYTRNKDGSCNPPAPLEQKKD